MSIVIKFLICLVFTLGSVRVVNNSNIRDKKRANNVCSIFFATLFAILVFIPIENFFLQFKSLEAAYEHRNPNAEIRLVVEGKESAFVSGNENGKETIMFVPKSNDVWKIGTGLETKRIARSIHENVMVEIYQYKDSSDFYGMVYDLHGREIDIVDSSKSKYVPLKKEKNNGKVITKYYAYILNYDENYWITVDDEQIELRRE